VRVTIKLFALARQAAEAEQVEVELPAAATVGDLRRALAAQHPALEPLLRHVLFAVDTEYASDATPLAADSEVACIPPVSGG
jgi:sulfur-carrier protein